MKILFAAGTQFAFPRLTRVVEAIAISQPSWPLIYQAGPGADLEALEAFRNLHVQAFYRAAQYQALFADAELVVTHAGMGNIMACLEQGKPFMMLPRLASLSEHRNDHQVDTAEAISRRYQVPFFCDIEKLIEAVIDFDPAHGALSGYPDEINHERQDFGQRLNGLIKSL